MAPLQDPEILAQYKSALSNWKVTGYVDWRDRAREWARKNLKNFTARTIAELMWQHVAAGGEIDQVPERRTAWNDRAFHYDLRVVIGGRRVYIETVLVDDDPEDPTIEVVSIHDV